MKFIVEQSALADCVNWVSRSLSTRPIKTELLGIVIDATGSNVELSGSDLETSSKAFFKADISYSGFWNEGNKIYSGYGYEKIFFSQ